MGEGRQNHPAAGYSHPLDEATDCDGVPPSSISSSSSSSSSTSTSCSSAVVVPLSPSSSLRANSYLLCRLLRVYRIALANLELEGVMHPLEWYVLPSSLTWQTSEQRESRAFCLNGNVQRYFVADSMANNLRKMIISYIRTIFFCILDFLLF